VWNTIEFDGEYRKAMICERIEMWRAFTGTWDIGRAHRVGTLSKSYAHRLSFSRFASWNFVPSWTLMGAPAPGKNCRKKEWPVREISVLSHWVTSGEVIFRESESNVTWRGKSEGTNVETVICRIDISTNVLVHPKSVSLFGKRLPRPTCVPRNCIKFHKLFHHRDSKV